MSLKGATEPEAEVGRIIDGLSERRDQITARMMERIFGAIADYANPDAVPGLTESVNRHCEAHITAFLESARRGRPPSQDEVGFLVEPVMARVGSGISLDGLLHAFRIGHGVVWEAVLEEADDAGAAVALAQPSMSYIDVVCTAVAEVYLGEAQRTAANRDRADRDLLEQLLGGERLGEAELRRASEFGFDGASVVVAVRPDEEEAVDGGPGITAGSIQRACAELGHPALVLPYRDLAVAITAVDDGDPAAVVRAISSALPAGARAAVSLPARGLAELPDAFRDSRTALSAATPETPVVSVGEHGAFPHLVGRADDTIRRMVAPGLRDLVADRGDAAREQVRTAVAYMDADLSVSETATRLFVHPNTVRYRLRQVEERAGIDLRRFGDLVELRVAVELSGLPATADPP